MAHVVVTERCMDCKHTVCVAVCPVDCFHEGENTLWIDPVECIDCGACIPECPEEAIFAVMDLPSEFSDAVKQNEEQSKVCPVIIDTKAPLLKRDDCKQDT